MAYIEFECPECHKTSVADEQIVGRWLDCPHCRKPVLYSRPAASPVEPRAGLFPAGPREIVTVVPAIKTAPAPETQGRPPAFNNTASKFLAVLAVAALVIAAAGGIALLATHPSPRRHAPTPNGATTNSVADAHPLTLLGQGNGITYWTDRDWGYWLRAAAGPNGENAEDARGLTYPLFHVLRVCDSEEVRSALFPASGKSINGPEFDKKWHAAMLHIATLDSDSSDLAAAGRQSGILKAMKELGW